MLSGELRKTCIVRKKSSLPPPPLPIDLGLKKVYFFKCNFQHLNIFKNVPKVVSVLEFPYILRILRKKLKKFGLKGEKNELKVKKDILSTHDIFISLFGRGEGGFSPFGATYL